MKIKLVLTRTERDPQNAWMALKTIDLDVPLERQDGWQVIGAE